MLLIGIMPALMVCFIRQGGFFDDGCSKKTSTIPGETELLL
jgi:hypothetical protein